jgi:hypothetical protein
VPDQRHRQRAISGEGFVVAAANLLHACDDAHRRRLAVGELQRDHGAVGKQTGAFRVGGVQQPLEVSDTTVDIRKLLGLLNLIGRVATIAAWVFVVLEPAEQPGSSLSQLGQLVGDALPAVVRKSRWSVLSRFAASESWPVNFVARHFGGEPVVGLLDGGAVVDDGIDLARDRHVDAVLLG